MIRISLVCPCLAFSVTIIVFLLKFPSHSCPFHLPVSSMNFLWGVWECIISRVFHFSSLCPISYFSLCFCHFPVFYIFQNRHWISFREYGNVQGSHLPCVPISLSVFILRFIILIFPSLSCLFHPSDLQRIPSREYGSVWAPYLHSISIPLLRLHFRASCHSPSLSCLFPSNRIVSELPSERLLLHRDLCYLSSSTSVFYFPLSPFSSLLVIALLLFHP